MTGRKTWLCLLIPLLFVLFWATGLLFCPTSFLPAYADEEMVFSYDGSAHVYSYDGAGDDLVWHKTGESEPAAIGRDLSVSHPSESGAYTLTSGEDLVLSLTVTCLPRELSPIWCVRRSSDAPAYVSNTRYIYNGMQQGVFPYPENAVLGDDIKFSVIGNVAKEAGLHTARIIGLGGANADDYVLRPGAEYFSYAIEKAPLTVTLSDAEVVFGDEFAGATALPVGLAPGDTEESIGGTVLTDYRLGNGVGTFPLSYSISSADYDVTVIGATLTVLPRPLSLVYEDGEGIYGEEPEMSFSIEGSRQFLIDPIPVLDGYHAGEHTLIGADAGDNFVLTVNPATYVIAPRPLSARFSCSPVSYGEKPSFALTVTSGGFADGDDERDLRVVYPSVPKNVGVYTVYFSSESSDYDATFSPCVVTVQKLPLTLTVSDVISRYGAPFLSPTLKTSEPLPYGETVADLQADVIKSGGWTCGTYPVLVTCNNPNYDVAPQRATYTILPATLRVILFLPTDGSVVRLGEPITPSFVYDNPVGDDDVTPIVTYHRIGANGLEEKQGTLSLSEAGEYVARVRLADMPDAENYRVVFPDTNTAVSRKFTLLGNVFTENDVTVVLRDGFDGAAIPHATSLEVNEYRKQYETAFEFQSIVRAFSLDLGGVKTQKMTVSVPVDHENRNYTAAIVREDGSVVYAPCAVENGKASFVTDAADRTYLIWEDKDSSPYLYLCVFLFLTLIVELIVLGVLYGKYRSKKPGYLAALPLGATLNGGNLYWLVGGSLFLGVACVIALVAIVVLVVKLKKAGKLRGFRKIQ